MKKSMELSTYLFFLIFIHNITFVFAQQAGTLDEFLNTEEANDGILTLALQEDGKILIGGSFTEYNGVPRRRIARLNPDGSLDQSFNPGAGANSFVRALSLQRDGKILVGGFFTSYNGALRNRIARLNPDGSLDESFDPRGGASNGVSTLALQGDGKILIGGDFTEYNGVERNYIARLNPDGSLDQSFNPRGGANDRVSTLALQGDGKILIGGDFTRYDGVERNNIARLNPDGSLDQSFNPGAGANGFVFTLALQGDGKILIGGSFTSYDGVERNNIARLNPDGSLDQSFNPEARANNLVFTLAFQGDGKILIGGFFRSYNGVPRNNITRLNPDGSLDQSFNPGAGANGEVNTLALQGNGKILIGGFFTSYNGVERNNIARLNPDGSLDQSFDPRGGASDGVSTLALQGDGKILMGGFFTSYNGALRNRIARLNPDGSLDESFNPRGGANDWVSTLALQGDGKILMGGRFTEYNGVPRNRIARLNPDGSLDESFNPEPGATRQVNTLALQGDGKILIGGSFTSYNGVPRNYIARLNPDGSLDESFNPEAGSSSDVFTLALQGDGKILMGGGFIRYNGVPRNYIARLNPDGSLDQSFNPGAGANSTVRALALQGDGKILMGGRFIRYNGVERNRIARLNPDGSLDQSFNPGAGANIEVSTLALQPNGRILLGGSFTSYDSTVRGNIARVYGSVPFIPENLRDTLKTDSSFVLTWDKVLGIDIYEVDVTEDNFLTTLPNYTSRFVRDTSLLIEGLEEGKGYVCRVRATNEQGDSPSSLPLVVPIAPAAPSNLRAEAIPNRAIRISWDASALPNTAYPIEFSEENDRNFRFLATITSTTFEHTNLVPSQRYFYRIRATNPEGGGSDYSEIVGAVTFPDIVTSTEDLKEAHIKIYPNPSYEFVSIEWLDMPAPNYLQILNSEGKKVMEKYISLEGQEMQVPLSSLPSGIYYLQLKWGEQTITKKIIKP